MSNRAHGFAYETKVNSSSLERSTFDFALGKYNTLPLNNKTPNVILIYRVTWLNWIVRLACMTNMFVLLGTRRINIKSDKETWSGVILMCYWTFLSYDGLPEAANTHCDTCNNNSGGQAGDDIHYWKSQLSFIPLRGFYHYHCIHVRPI